jgi:hypothetical protein
MTLDDVVPWKRDSLHHSPFLAAARSVDRPAAYLLEYAL